MSKLFFLMTILALAIGTMYVVGCGDDDDDDDTTDDDTTVADDDAASDCETGLAAVYDDCGLALADAEGNQLTYDDAVAACDAGDAIAACAAGCGLTAADCDELATCFTDNCAA